MLKISFEINGKEVSADKLADEWEKSIIEKIGESLRDRTGALECPVHHQGATVVLKGNDLGSLVVSIQGCCDEFQHTVEDKLRN